MTTFTLAALFQNNVFTGLQSHGIFAWICVGMLAGWIAGKLTRGRGYGCLFNIVLGLIGAVLGGWLCTKLGIQGLGFWGSLAAATVGAVILVALAKLIFGGDNQP